MARKAPIFIKVAPFLDLAATALTPALPPRPLLAASCRPSLLRSPIGQSVSRGSSRRAFVYFFSFQRAPTAILGPVRRKCCTHKRIKRVRDKNFVVMACCCALSCRNRQGEGKRLFLFTIRRAQTLAAHLIFAPSRIVALLLPKRHY